MYPVNKILASLLLLEHVAYHTTGTLTVIDTTPETVSLGKSIKIKDYKLISPYNFVST